MHFLLLDPAMQVRLAGITHLKPMEGMPQVSFRFKLGYIL